MYVADSKTIGYLTSGDARRYDLKIDVYDDSGSFQSTINQDLIYPFNVTDNIQAGDYFTIGSITASTLKIPLDESVVVPNNGELRIFVRLDGDTGYGDYIPMGRWFVDKRFPSGDSAIMYHCYDELLRAESTYVSALSYPSTAQLVWDEIISQLGLSSSVTLPSKSIGAALSGDTHRIALGDIAAYCGGSVIINRTGEVDIVYPYANTTPTLTISGDVWGGFEKIDDDTKTISRVTCIYNSGGNYVSLGDDTGYELIFYSRLINSTALLQDVFDDYDGLTFVPYTSLNWIGDPRVDLGDLVTVVDKDGSTNRMCYLMTTDWSYGGGLSMTNSSIIESETESEFNITYGLDKFVRSSVKQGVPYYGTTIDTEKGLQIKRSDGVSETTLNSDTWEVLIDGIQKLYADFSNGEMYFNGKLTADVIEALTGIIASNLTAEKAVIAELTVDQLDTSDKVQNFLVSDISDVNYIKIDDERIEFITAQTDGSSSEQVTNRNGESMYWIDDTHEGSSSEVTAYPVMQYVYEELTKAAIKFETDASGAYSPRISLGAGTGVDDRGKSFLEKTSTGVRLMYYSTVDGAQRYIELNDAGITTVPDISGDGGGGVTSPTLEALDISNTTFTTTYDGVQYVSTINKSSDGKISSIVTGSVVIPITYS